MVLEVRSGPARDFELWDVVSYRRRTNRDSIWIGTRRTFRRPSGLTLRKEATDQLGLLGELLRSMLTAGRLP
jgi:hypothetical protein